MFLIHILYFFMILLSGVLWKHARIFGLSCTVGKFSPLFWGIFQEMNRFSSLNYGLNQIIDRQTPELNHPKSSLVNKSKSISRMGKSLAPPEERSQTYTWSALTRHTNFLNEIYFYAIFNSNLSNFCSVSNESQNHKHIKCKIRA
jgi:hypothetical protein